VSELYSVSAMGPPQKSQIFQLDNTTNHFFILSKHYIINIPSQMFLELVAIGKERG
jgi:hypothetical protein